MENMNSTLKKIILGSIILLCVLLAVYFGMAIYFMDHFYFGTEINSISVSGKAVEEVKEQMASKLQEYELIIKERDGRSEQINSIEIGLNHDPSGVFDEFKDKQSPYKWISALFNSEKSKMTAGVSYDEKLLKERIDRLSCFDEDSIIEPQNPTFRYTGSSYEIIGEVNGNRVDRDILYSHVADAILKGETELDLESIGCYVNPRYTSSSQKVIEARDILNRHVSSKITYTFGGTNEVLDGSIISSWLTVDEDFNVTLDEESVKKYVNEISKKYNTVGTLRNFLTSSGKTIDVSGGDYKWTFDTAKEVQELIECIKTGKNMVKELTYIKSAYVEIDLSLQHLWFYKDGSLVTQGDIVSGHAGGSLATPEGVYKLKNKKKNAILRGDNYTAPVNFWMPFNGGIGIHDATWRRKFGGDIYKRDGSHGCINCPYDLAKTIYENIDVGTPVICYY